MKSFTTTAAESPEFDESGCVYANVTFGGRVYSVQFSRPRHPSDLGVTLDTGADIHTDDGHDDNADLSAAVSEADLDWEDVSQQIIEEAKAEGALDALERSAGQEKIDVYTTEADRETGEWIGEKTFVRTETRAEFHSRQDTNAVRYDTYEHGQGYKTQTQAIEVRLI